MTTIAYKDGLLAADSQETLGEIRLDGPLKIRTLPNGTIIACAGSVAKIRIAEEFFSKTDWENNLNEAPQLKGGFDAILIYKGRILACTNSLVATPVEHPFYAIGSGWHLAMSAMHLGLSAPDAVKLASEIDIYTNDKVQTVNVQNLLHQEASERPRRASARKTIQKA